MICNNKVKISKHAQTSMNERNVCEAEVRAILKLGRKEPHWQKGEARFRVLITKSQVKNMTNPRALALLDLIVILSPDKKTVITVFSKAAQVCSGFKKLGRGGELQSSSLEEYIDRVIFANLNRVFGIHREDWI